MKHFYQLFRQLVLLALVVGCQPADSSPAANPQTPPGAISLLAWNVESGGADPSVIAEQLKHLGGYDVYALSEVSPDDFEIHAAALGSNYQSIESKTGRSDRLQILFNTDRFELVRKQEMDHYRDYILNNETRTHRSPLMVHLRQRDTGVEFLVVANHLARGNEDLREKQAIGLREWARDQTLPTITIGDFNFDYDFPTEKGNEAFVEMMRDNVWLWVQPEEFIDTNWADSDGDGNDNYPHSMLDFAFVAGPAKTWNPTCRVIVRDGDFPDTQQTSDHRPVELIVTPPDSAGKTSE